MYYRHYSALVQSEYISFIHVPLHNRKFAKNINPDHASQQSADSMQSMHATTDQAKT